MREMEWTDEQAEAIIATDHVLLTASAGTGKTTTIVGKVLWLLGLAVGVRRSNGRPIPPCPQPCQLEEIAAITFTEKAAYDLKRNLRHELRDSERGDQLHWEVDRAAVGTIHGFCRELLRDHALRLAIDPTFRVLDEREAQLRQDELIRDLLYRRLERNDAAAVELVRRFGLYGFRHQKGAIEHVREVLRDIRWRRRRYDAWTTNGELVPEAITERGALWPAGEEPVETDRAAVEDACRLYAVAHEVASEWLAWLEAENARDFDSLILDARRLLTHDETRPALANIRRRFRILIIDEFQDTDDAQRDIAFAIAGLDPAHSDEPALHLADPEGEERDPEREEPDPEREEPDPEGENVQPAPQLFLVGDPKQSIYRFRGADISVWNRVSEALGGMGRELRLTHNFRSERAVVRFVNRVCSRAMAERSAALAEIGAPEGRVDYAELSPHRPVSRAGAVEWLAAPDASKKEDREAACGRLVAWRIRELIERRTPIVDPASRPGTDPGEGIAACRYRHIAVLGRIRKNLTHVEEALREQGIPYYRATTAGLADRQEVIDLVSVLRVLDNPWDDLHAFALLRSPFVGLRDEALARIRLDPVTGRTSLLRQARRWLDAVESGEAEPFAAPESPRVAEVELEALRSGLEALDRARRLVDRVDPAELLEIVLEATGYRLHLLLRRGAQEAISNIERFLVLAEEYRHLPLGSFLELWDRWGEQDLGIPQAPLYSDQDDVVTISTVHTAKGLEWPVVFLVGLEEGKAARGLLTHAYLNDPRYGPVFMPAQRDRGPRSRHLLERAQREEHAEEARLLYVAMTRARDRLVVVGSTEQQVGYGAWLSTALPDAVDGLELDSLGSDSGGLLGGGGDDDAEPPDGNGPLGPEDGDGQLSLFAARPGARTGTTERWSAPEPPLLILRHLDAGSSQSVFPEAPITLAWLEGIVLGEAPDLVRPLERPPHSFLSSATELRMKERHLKEWKLRYVHGVQPVWRFAPKSSAEEALDPIVRGRLIHGVLERIEEAAEIARVLDETVSGIDAAEVEELLQPGTEYREALEREIERVVASPEWRWYVEPPHHPALHRELPFLHLIGPRQWRQGAFDLYRPASGSDSGRGAPAAAGPEAFAAGPEASSAAGEASRLQPSLFATADEALRSARSDTWIVDFKTHQIPASQVEPAAAEYDVQVRVYREAAAAILGGANVRVALHFTHPNLAVER